MDPETRVSYRRYSTMKIFNIVDVLLNFELTQERGCLPEVQTLIFYSFKHFKIRVIINFFYDLLKKKKLRLIKKEYGVRFMFFLICYIFLKKNLRITSVFLISNKFMIIKRLYYLAFTYKYNLK